MLKIPPPPPPSPRLPREITPETNNFCPTSLRDWLQVCRNAGVPHIPAEQIGTISLSDYLRFDQPGEHQDRLLANVNQAQAAMKPRHMVRFDCCAPFETKCRLSQGSHEWHPDLARIILDDPRLYDIMWEQPREDVPLWQRPWIEATLLEGYPVEYRVFVTNGEVNGVSNYYPQRPLPINLKTLQQAQTAIDLTNRLIEHIPTPFLWNESNFWPSFKEAFDTNKIHFTADFMVDASGEVLFLEGGPPHEMGAHPCCFTPGMTSGVALANQNPTRPEPSQTRFISDDQPPNSQGFIDHLKAEVATLQRRNQELTMLHRGEIDADPAWNGNERVDSGAEFTTLKEVAAAANALLEDPEVMLVLSNEEIQTLQQVAAPQTPGQPESTNQGN